MTRNPDTVRQGISKKRLMRSVASSSAIETGESTAVIEKRLQEKRKFPNLTLAR
ncbi:MAG: hypothetical protein K6L60_15215 [Oceanobacter sp.]